MAKFRPVLANHDILLHAATVPSEASTTDGHMICGNFVIAEGKNEIGSDGVETFLEAILYYRKFS